MTGTRAFMAVGLLLGDEHSFMHDLESFFWVLFWICNHHNGPNRLKSKVHPYFDEWNYPDTETLATNKKGVMDDEGDFLLHTEKHFTPYFRPVAPWVNRLRKVVFPNNARWKTEDIGL